VFWVYGFVVSNGVDSLELQDINVGVVGQETDERHKHFLICMCL